MKALLITNHELRWIDLALSGIDDQIGGQGRRLMCDNGLAMWVNTVEATRTSGEVNMPAISMLTSLGFDNDTVPIVNGPAVLTNALNTDLTREQVMAVGHIMLEEASG